MNSTYQRYSRKVIRLFISSTFADFHAERNALRNDVFPKLNDLCLESGLRFESVDLRWGISEQAVENNRILQICLSEIKRCRKISNGPYMLVLLGSRYGTPLIPESIDENTFELILANLDRNDSKAVARCYKLDRNPLNAVYRLQSESIRPLSRKILLSCLEEGAAKIQSIAASHLISSATDHEVQEALVDTSRIGGVHCFFRELRISSTGSLSAPWVDTNSKGDLDPEAQEKLVKLKGNLHKTLTTKIRTFKTAVVEDKVETKYIQRFCKGVYQQLADAICSSFEKSASPSSSQIEDSQQRYFLVSRSASFTGRESYLKRVRNYINGSATQPLILYGSSGDGKSAILAKVAEELLNSNHRLIYRFIGASPKSSDGRSLLLGLCRELADVVGVPSPSHADNAFQIAQNFRTLIQNVKESIVIIIDAIDQLTGEDESKYLTWIPKDIPGNVRLILSSTDGDGLRLLRQKGIADKQFSKLPPLSLKDANHIIKRLSRQYRTYLTISQRNMITAGFRECRSPLFLYLAFQRAKQWASYDRPRPLGSCPDEAVKMLLKSLSSEDNHGSVFVRKCIRLIALSRFGLSHGEMCNILARDDDVIRDVSRRHPESPDPGLSFPPILWFRLYYDLLPYLKTQNIDGIDLFSFFHDVWSNAVTESLRPSTKKEVHAQFANYFLSARRPGVTGVTLSGKKPPLEQKRFLSECPFHQSNARLGSSLGNTLLNENFLQTKINLFGIHALIADFTNALKKMRRTLKIDSPVQELFDFLTRFSDILARYPEEFAVQLLASQSSFRSKAIKQIIKAVILKKEGIWLRPLPQGDIGRTVVRRFDYKQGVSPAFSENRRYRSSSRIWGIDSFSKGGKVIAAHHDSIIRISDLTTGMLEGVLVGHNAAVSDVALSVDQKTILSVSNDGTLIVWSAISYEKLMEFRTKEGLESLVCHPTLQIVATGGTTGMVRIWDLEAGKQIRAMKGHKDTVWSLRFDPSGELLYTVSQDGRMIKRLVADGKIIKILDPWIGPYWNRNLIRAVDVSWDSKYLVVGDGNGEICVIDNDRFEVIRNWHAHDSVIRDLAMTPDIKKIVSVSQDGFVKLWNLKRGTVARSFNDHGAPVHAVRIDEKGKYVYTGDDNGKILIWDLDEMRRKRIKSPVHKESIVKFIPMYDEQRLVSASSDGQIAIWDLKSRKVIYSKKLAIDTYNFDYLANCLLHRNDRHLIVLSRDKLFCIDLDTNRLRQKSTNNVEVFTNFVSFQDEERLIVNLTEGSELSWWSVPRLESMRTMKLGPLSISSFSLSRDQSNILVSSLDGTFTLIKISGHRRKRIKLAKKLASSKSILFIDNQRAVSHLQDRSLCIFDLESRKVIDTFANGMEIVSFVFHKDKRKIIVASHEGCFYVWNHSSGKHRKIGQVPNRDVSNINFIAKRSLLLFVTSGSTLNLYNCDSRTLLSTYSVHSEISHYCLIDGHNKVVVGETSGKIHFLGIEK